LKPKEKYYLCKKNMIINTLLDNDLYKFNMLQFIVDQKFDKLIVGWKFFGRNNNKFPIGFGKALQEEIDSWKNLNFTDEELDFIYSRTKSWINYDFIYGYLKSYKMLPELIDIHTSVYVDDEGNEYERLLLGYYGEWAKVIMFEVPLLAAMNEIYNKLSPSKNILNFEEISNRNYEKFRKMKELDIGFYEFGSRRRFSANNQKNAIQQAMDFEVIKGISNLYYAKIFDLPLFGTMAHELFSVFAAIYGVESANYQVISKWSKTFNGSLGIALTDTFTTESFYQHSFDRFHAKLFDGLREDSTVVPFNYVDDAIEMYNKLGINPKTKKVVHSNGINSVKLMNDLLNYRKNEIGRDLGVGTFITNDVSREGSGRKLNNWVIKTTFVIVNGQKRYTAKLSDTTDKVTSIDQKTVACYKYLLGV
jgi:nicotinate phosphoribosyltransferase